MSMSLRDVKFDEFFNVFENLDKLGKRYHEQVSGKDPTNGNPATYTNIFLTLRRYFPDFRRLKILEAGSGPGYFLYCLNQLGADVYAIDKQDQGGFPQKNGIKFCHQNLLHLPERVTPRHLFPETDFDEFDVVISRLLLEYPVTTVEETIKILKLLRPLSKLHIHEQTPLASNLRFLDFKNLGYHATFEISPYVTQNEVCTLIRM